MKKLTLFLAAALLAASFAACGNSGASSSTAPEPTAIPDDILNAPATKPDPDMEIDPDFGVDPEDSSAALQPEPDAELSGIVDQIYAAHPVDLMMVETTAVDLTNAEWTQGDVVTTVIKCAHGQTIVLTLDTTLPRWYSRGFHIQGTKAMFDEDTRSIFIDGEHNKYDFDWSSQWKNVEEFREKYEHPIWKQYLSEGVTGSHGGIDWLVFSAFFDAVKKGTQTPIDVYDMAAWMCITPLSAQSIAMGGAPVAIPDFTNGRWINREPIVEGKYCLEKVCEE